MFRTRKYHEEGNDKAKPLGDRCPPITQEENFFYLTVLNTEVEEDIFSLSCVPLYEKCPIQYSRFWRRIRNKEVSFFSGNHGSTFFPRANGRLHCP